MPLVFGTAGNATYALNIKSLNSSIICTLYSQTLENKSSLAAPNPGVGFAAL